MPKVCQFTVRRLVTLRSSGTPWMLKLIVEPRRAPMSSAKSCSRLTSAWAGSFHSAPATILLSFGSSRM